MGLSHIWRTHRGHPTAGPELQHSGEETPPAMEHRHQEERQKQKQESRSEVPPPLTPQAAFVVGAQSSEVRKERGHRHHPTWPELRYK